MRACSSSASRAPRMSKSMNADHEAHADHLAVDAGAGGARRSGGLRELRLEWH